MSRSRSRAASRQRRCLRSPVAGKWFTVFLQSRRSWANIGSSASLFSELHGSGKPRWVWVISARAFSRAIRRAREARRQEPVSDTCWCQGSGCVGNVSSAPLPGEPYRGEESDECSTIGSGTAFGSEGATRRSCSEPVACGRHVPLLSPISLDRIRCLTPRCGRSRRDSGATSPRRRSTDGEQLGRRSLELRVRLADRLSLGDERSERALLSDKPAAVLDLGAEARSARRLG